MTKVAIITLSRVKNEKSDKEIRDHIRKAIATNRLLKGWKIDKIAILSE